MPVTLHPTLRDHWTNFEGDLNTQLTNAQRDEYCTDEDANMASVEAPRAPDVPQQQHVHHPKQHSLYPLTIPPTTDFQSNAPYTDISSAGPTSGYESTSDGVPYSSTASQSHHHPPQGAYHYYPPSTSSSSQAQGYAYRPADDDVRYDAYARHAYPTRHPPPDRGERDPARYYSPPPPQHAHAADGAYPLAYTAAAAHHASVPRYHDTAHGAPRHRWDDYDDDPRRSTYPDPPPRAPPQVDPFHVQYVPYGGYAAYTGAGGMVVPQEELPQPREQLRLQETWQSFGVYVGSARPTP